MSWLSAWLGSNSSSDSSPKASSVFARVGLGLLLLFILPDCEICNLCTLAGKCMVRGIVVALRALCGLDRSDPLVSILWLFLLNPIADAGCWWEVYVVLPSLDHFVVTCWDLVWCSVVYSRGSCMSSVAWPRGCMCSVVYSRSSLFLHVRCSSRFRVDIVRLPRAHTFAFWWYVVIGRYVCLAIGTLLLL